MKLKKWELCKLDVFVAMNITTITWKQVNIRTVSTALELARLLSPHGFEALSRIQLNPERSKDSDDDVGDMQAWSYEKMEYWELRMNLKAQEEQGIACLLQQTHNPVWVLLQTTGKHQALPHLNPHPVNLPCFHRRKRILLEKNERRTG